MREGMAGLFIRLIDYIWGSGPLAYLLVPITLLYAIVRFLRWAFNTARGQRDVDFERDIDTLGQYRSVIRERGQQISASVRRGTSSHRPGGRRWIVVGLIIPALGVLVSNAYADVGDGSSIGSPTNQIITIPAGGTYSIPITAPYHISIWHRDSVDNGEFDFYVDGSLVGKLTLSPQEFDVTTEAHVVNVGATNEDIRYVITTPTPTPTATTAPTSTDTTLPTATHTSVPTDTPEPPTATATQTATPSYTAAPTGTETATNAPTATQTATASATGSVPTDTPLPATATATEVPPIETPFPVNYHQPYRVYFPYSLSAVASRQ